MDTLDFIMQFEGGEISTEEVIDGFSHLIKTGIVWSLQGSYGRTAANLIESGYISPDGEVLEYPEPEYA